MSVYTFRMCNFLKIQIRNVYYSFDHGIRVRVSDLEAEWLRDLLLEVPLAIDNVSGMSIHCDSQSTLARAYSEMYNGKSRHISLTHDYVTKSIND